MVYIVEYIISYQWQIQKFLEGGGVNGWEPGGCLGKTFSNYRVLTKQTKTYIYFIDISIFFLKMDHKEEGCVRSALDPPQPTPVYWFVFGLILLLYIFIVISLTLSM